MNKTLASLALAAAPLAAFPAVLVSQPSAFSTSTNAANVGYYSDAYSTSGGQNYATTEADDFTLSSLSTLSSIVFYGSSEYYANADLTNIASFQVRVLNSSFTSVYDTTVTKASLSPTLTGAMNNAGGYEYSFTLNTTQALAAGSYYLNIGAILTDGTSDAFAWSAGSGGTSTHFYNTFSGTSYTSSTPDLAFVINGVQAVPEPAPFAALGLGVVALLRRRR